MGRTIVVDPAKLDSTATKIEQQTADYTKNYTKLMSEVDTMGNAWQGTDNVAFVSQIKGFMDDFEKMKKLLDEYSAFLRKSAQTYKKTQENVVSGAKALSN